MKANSECAGKKGRRERLCAGVVKNCFLVLALGIGLLWQANATAADTVPPRIIAFSLSPTNIDVTESSQSVLITARITDSLSGVKGGKFESWGWAAPTFIIFTSASGQSVTTGLTFAGGNAYDGIYTNVLVFPRYSESGVWTPQYGEIEDEAGNAQSLEYRALLGMGFPAEVHVTGTSDTTPPELVEFGFWPNMIDTGASNRLVHFQARFKEDLSGIVDDYDYVGITLYSPSMRQYFGTHLTRMSGDAWDRVYTNSVEVPQFSEPGNWTVSFVTLSDAAGNQGSYSGLELLGLGFPSLLSVTGLGDTNCAVVEEFSLTPAKVNTSHSPGTIQCTARVTDDLSGFNLFSSFSSSIYVTFTSPSGRQSVSGSLSLPWGTPGVTLDAILTNSITVPRFSEPGLWLLGGITVFDNANNYGRVELAEARSAGLAYSFIVEEFPMLRITTSQGAAIVSWPASALGYRLQASESCGDATGWADVSVPPVQIGEEYVVAAPLGNGPRYYRLVKEAE